MKATMQSVHANRAGSVWETQRGDDWRDSAACVGENPELWFSYSEAELYVARTICQGCPVKAQCLEFAAEVDRQHGKHGIWAGLDESERTRGARRSPVECGTLAGFKRHRRMKTLACQPCLDAKAEASREEYAKARQGRSASSLLEELDALRGETPSRIAERLGMTLAGISRALRRRGLHERAREFDAARHHQRKEAS